MLDRMMVKVCFYTLVRFHYPEHWLIRKVIDMVVGTVSGRGTDPF